MECSSIREKLSEYLENAVSREEKVLIEEHLKSCARCSIDLADLKKTIEHIRGLEEVEPPAWIAQKIMAELREEARPKKGILWRLFYPPHIKLPLEAIAAILVVGIALYIYQDMKPGIKFAKAPSEESAPHISQREIVKEAKRDSFTRSGPIKVPSKITKAQQKLAQEPVSGEKEARTGDVGAVPPEPRSSALSIREERGVATAIPSNELTTFEGASKNEEKQKTVRATQELKPSSKGETESLGLTVKVMELESATNEVEKIIVALGGTIVEKQSREGRRIFLIDLRTSNYNELFEKLKIVGDVEGKGLSLKGHKENLRVRIMIVEVKSESPDLYTPH